MTNPDRSAVVARLSKLGVPAGFQAAIATRPAPRFHVWIQLAIVLGAIAVAVAAMSVWSRSLDAAALAAATARHALLYDSDIGAETLGLLVATLCAVGWIGGAFAWWLGRDIARNATAADLCREPGKYKGAINWLQKQMIRRHTAGSSSAEEFLDRLAMGMPKDFRLATLAMLVLTLALGWIAPARISYATDEAVTDHPVALFEPETMRKIADASAIVSGCPDLPKTGTELVYRLRFVDGAENSLGNWRPLGVSRLAALEAIAAKLSTDIQRERFSNPIRSNPLAAACLQKFGDEERAGGLERLLKLLSITEVERSPLKGLL